MYLGVVTQALTVRHGDTQSYSPHVCGGCDYLNLQITYANAGYSPHVCGGCDLGGNEHRWVLTVIVPMYVGVVT